MCADAENLKTITMGGVVGMGRKTWESIPPKYRPLQGRTNIVLSHDPNYDTMGGAHVVCDGIEAIIQADNKDLFIIGGAKLYKQFLPIADRIELTIVDTVSAGDAYFPSFDESEWTVLHEEAHQADEKNLLSYTFRTLVRK